MYLWPDERISILITNMIKCNNACNEIFWELGEGKKNEYETYFMTSSEPVGADMKLNVGLRFPMMPCFLIFSVLLLHETNNTEMWLHNHTVRYLFHITVYCLTITKLQSVFYPPVLIRDLRMNHF